MQSVEHLGREEAHAVVAGGLGPPQRRLRAAQDQVRLGAVHREHGDADGGAHLRFVLADRDRLFDHGQNLVRHRGDVALAAHLLQNQRELVAAQPAQHVPFAQLHRHAPAELHQQRVAGVVTEALVDLAEGGEVDQQHGAGAARLHRGEQRALELADEVVAVGQLGERIEVRQLLDAPLRLAALHELAPQGGLALADALEQGVDVGGERADLVVRLGRCAQLEALLRDRPAHQSRERTPPARGWRCAAARCR